MVYDLGAYRRVIRPQIKTWMAKRPSETPYSQVGAIALATSCPIVVVCYLMEELYGSDVHLTNAIEILSKFYQVDKVIDTSSNQISID